MKRFKVIFIAFIILAMIVSIFSGCDKDEEPAKTSAPAETSASNAEQTQESEQTEMTNEGITFPVTEDIAIDICMAEGPLGEDPNNASALKWLIDESGIAINVIGVQGANTVEKVQVMMTSGEYPDVFLGSILRTDDVTKYGPSGVFLDSNNYISEEATPNIYQLMVERPEAKGVCTAPDGGLYSLPLLNEVEGGYLEFFYIINDNFLDAVGREKPTTMDELYNTLLDFKTMDANGNGKEDEIGTAFAVNHAFCHFEGALGSWGMPTKPGTYENLSYLKDDVVLFAPSQDEYKAAITYYNKLYNEGLLDIESFTQDVDTLNAKITNEDVQTIGAIGYWGDPPEGYSYMAPPSADGITPRWYIHPGYLGIKNRLVITNKHEQPEYIYALLDTFYYDFETSLYLAYGDTVTINDDGTYTFELLPDEYSTFAEFQWANGGFATIPAAMKKDQFDLCTNEIADNPRANIARVNAYFKGGYQEVANTEIWPRPYSNTEYSDELLAIKADIFAAVDQKKAEWIMGDIGLVDQEWDTFQEQLEAMGLPRMMELLQMDYDVFKAGQTVD